MSAITIRPANLREHVSVLLALLLQPQALLESGQTLRGLGQVLQQILHPVHYTDVVALSNTASRAVKLSKRASRLQLG